MEVEQIVLLFIIAALLYFGTRWLAYNKLGVYISSLVAMVFFFSMAYFFLTKSNVWSNNTNLAYAGALFVVSIASGLLCGSSKKSRRKK